MLSFILKIGITIASCSDVMTRTPPPIRVNLLTVVWTGTVHPWRAKLLSLTKLPLIRNDTSRNMFILWNWIIWMLLTDANATLNNLKYFTIYVIRLTILMDLNENRICSNILVCFPDEIVAQRNIMKTAFLILNENHFTIKKLLISSKRARSLDSEYIFGFKIG